MRPLILCFALLVVAPLGACAPMVESHTSALAPNASEGAMTASRSTARAHQNSAVDRSLRGG